jgi:multidrug efflux pump subunit AcrB
VVARRLSHARGQRKAEFFIFEHGVDELNDWAPILLQKMQALPKLANVASDQQSAGRTLTIEVNRDVAFRLGVDPALVDSILYDAFGQRRVARIYTTLNQYYVILEVDPGYQLGQNALSRIYAKSAGGGMVPLSQFATVSPSIAPLAINHQGQFPSVTLSFNPASTSTVGEAVSAIQKTAADLHMPPSIAASFQGNAQAFQSSHRSTPILILAALVAVYLILGMLYESTIHPLTIISTLPSAAWRPADLDAVRYAARRDGHHRDHPLDRHRQEERRSARRLRPDR